MMNKSFKTILATVYAVNPYKGSEDGMGWNFVYQIARFNRVIAVTRENNRSHIEKYMKEHPDQVYDNMQFLYFDLPYWMRFWKKGGRGAMLYYLMWQKALPSFIKKTHQNFDVVHNVNFHNDWTPSYLWKLDKPFVWGPIGHHPQVPDRYLKPFNGLILLREKMTWLFKKIYWNLSPALKNTLKYADHVICMNKSVAKVLDLGNKKYSIIPSVASQKIEDTISTEKKGFTLISAGRLVSLKGFDLSIKSFARFLSKLTAQERVDVKLVIVGSGPLEKYYKDLSHKYLVNKNIEFVNWVDRMELMRMYSGASAFLFPSHEGAGMVVAEALSYGLPVICLDNCGPGEFIDENCGFKASVGDYETTVDDLASAIKTLYEDTSLRQKMGEKAKAHFEKNFSWEVRGEQLREVYQDLKS